MGSHIIEYIGREGVKTEAAQFRMAKPRVGDPILWPNGKIGRLDAMPSSQPNGWPEPGNVHCCCGLGSVFWGWNEEERRATVSISGGPFISVKLDDLKPTYRYRLVNFWNWGDHSSGADQGVEYTVARPLFEYAGDSRHYSIACSCKFQSSTCTTVLDPKCPTHGENGE